MSRLERPVERPLGEKTMDDGFGDVDPRDVIRLFREIGFRPPVHPDDGDWPGLTFAGRSEVKMALLQPSQPMGVSEPISTASRAFFAALARHRGKAQVVAD